MAFASGVNATLLIGGYNLSTYFRRVTVNREKSLLETTTYGDTAREFIEGLRRGGLTMSGLFEPTDDTQDEQLNAAFTATAITVLTFGPQASTIGNLAYVCRAWSPSYGIESPLEDVVTVDADIEGDSDSVLRGHWLHNLSAKTAATSGAGVDNGAGSTLGGRANLHVTAFTGTSATIKIQDSTTDAGYVDVTGGAFTAVSGVTAESISMTGTVRAFARYDLSGTFTSVTFAVALGRRN